MEKLRTIRLNQQKAVELAQLVLKREKKKQALVVSLGCWVCRVGAWDEDFRAGLALVDRCKGQQAVVVSPDVH